MSASDLVGTIAAVLLMLAFVGAVIFVIAQTRRRRRIVLENSTALAELGDLNDGMSLKLNPLPPASFTFTQPLKSKARLDRFDLDAYFLRCLAEHEANIGREVDIRLQQQQAFGLYLHARDQIADAHLGKSGSLELDPEHFTRIELRLFQALGRQQPPCNVYVSCAATYTSPQGQNHYAKSHTWDFEGVSAGLGRMRELRAHRATSQFLKQQERNRVTPRVRAQIIARDGSRCRMCGATAVGGARLHVDHVIPIDRGGRSTMDNLQTLCQECNLGKGNLLL